MHTRYPAYGMDNSSQPCTPPLKDQAELTLADFNLHPIWVRVQDYDREQPWFAGTTEQTYRPWNGPLPIEAESQFPFILLRATFRFACGDIHPGHFAPATKEWDNPLPPRRRADGSFSAPLQWSARRGGSPLSILSLHQPVIFLGEEAFDFHLRRDSERRKQCILDFYSAFLRLPKEVFPVEFEADPAFFNGIVNGRLDGFYTFPLDKPFEIDTGERFLNGTN